MFWSEKKPVTLIQQIYRERGRLCAVFFHRCLGTGATSGACLMEPNHRRFTGCAGNSTFVERVMLSSLKIFSWQFLKKNSDKVGRTELRIAADLDIHHFVSARCNLYKEFQENICRDSCGEMCPSRYDTVHILALESYEQDETRWWTLCNS